MKELLKKSVNNKIDNPLKEKHYKDRRLKVFIRMSLTYLVPTFIMILFLINEYFVLLNEGLERRLISVAESQARILDIFMMERTRNLLNKIDSPHLEFPMKKEKLNKLIEELRTDSKSFIDLGYFDGGAVQTVYSGPEESLENKDYCQESWFIRLMKGKERYVVTDIYPGFRNKPHFTIGVKRQLDSTKTVVFKSSLDPERIYDYVTAFEKSQDVVISIVNKEGNYQLVELNGGNLDQTTRFSPDTLVDKGINTIRKDKDKDKIVYAYAWLAGTDWAVIVREKPDSSSGIALVLMPVILPAFLLIIVLIVIFIFRSKSVVIDEYEKDIVKTQLRQASKLAAVGELASGIAHEIGNPLNIIANEVGIMQDYTNPKYGMNKSLHDLHPHFDKIMKAVFRVKDINRKMLTFVRVSESNPEELDVHEVINDFTSGFFEHEMLLRNIELIREFREDVPKIRFDDNQFRQALINLLNNAADAIIPPGKIFISTRSDDKNVYISVTDTGHGISPENIEKIFLPFFTTKPAGKGTGLGLSVTYSIIKSFGGDISVESIPGKGTSFTIILPI